MNNFQKFNIFGQLPSERFGHTITYIEKGKDILFGGKWVLNIHGQLVILGYKDIQEIHSHLIFKENNGKVLKYLGTAPNPRAAHVAVCVDINQIVIYGGETGGIRFEGQFQMVVWNWMIYIYLRSIDDIRQWTVVPVVGTTPGRMYGHTLTFAKPFLIVFGGSTFQEPVNDCWCANVEKTPFIWVKIECKSEQPKARLYHSASVCTNGIANAIILIFGGCSKDQLALNDAWELRRDKDGKLDWLRVPYKYDKVQPKGRYQHSSLLVYSMFIVIGGKTGNLGEILTIDIYDIETSEWSKFICISRFIHSSWSIDTNIFIYGGFEFGSSNNQTHIISKIKLNKLLLPSKPLTNKLAQYQDALKNYTLTLNESPALSDIYNSSLNSSLIPNRGVAKNYQINNKKQQKPMFQYQDGKSSFKFINQAIVAVETDYSKANNKEPMISQIGQDYNITDIFLNTLLQPKNFINLQMNAKFLFQPQDIIMLCDQAEAIIKEQPIVLRCNAPIKIFGDIHGEYSVLMRFFDLWGSPFLNGKDDDIDAFDYLFLGNFVDRGNHSLETICLLLALKVRYPESIHLIRGNHEDKWINNVFGFSEECSQRLGEDTDDDDSVFARFNRLFEWLPLAAIVEDKILCVHGGIGFTLNNVTDIENLQRPLEVNHEVTSLEQQLIIDILWSDPTDSDNEFGIQPNHFRDPTGIGGIVKFGPDRVIQFLLENRLSLIIRSHECVMDGFERFAGGQLLTVSSTIDYCGKHKNAGAILIIKKNLEIIPKLIDPKFINDQNQIENEEILQQIYPITQGWKKQSQHRSYK